MIPLFFVPAARNPRVGSSFCISSANDFLTRPVSLTLGAWCHERQRQRDDPERGDSDPASRTQAAGRGITDRRAIEDCIGRPWPDRPRRVLALGVGAAMHPHKLTATGLARVLEEKVLATEVRLRVRELARCLRAEDGLATAHDLVEQRLRRNSWSTAYQHAV